MVWCQRCWRRIWTLDWISNLTSNFQMRLVTIPWMLWIRIPTCQCHLSRVEHFPTISHSLCSLVLTTRIPTSLEMKRVTTTLRTKLTNLKMATTSSNGNHNSNNSWHLDSQTQTKHSHSILAIHSLALRATKTVWAAVAELDIVRIFSIACKTQLGKWVKLWKGASSMPWLQTQDLANVSMAK